MWTIAGEDALISFDFTLDGQFVLPDEDSVKVTLRNANGDLLWDRLPQPGVDKTTLNLTIPAGLNLVGEGLIFETRYVRVSYTVDGHPRSTTKNYRISQFLPIETTEAKVRARLGASEQEIPNHEIDLYAAYFKLIDSGYVNLSQAIKSNSAASLSANNAVEIKAAIEQLPALASKLAQSESQDNATRVRMKLDIPRLRNELTAALSEELNAMDQSIGGVSEQLPTLMVLTTPDNIMTA